MSDDKRGEYLPGRPPKLTTARVAEIGRRYAEGRNGELVLQALDLCSRACLPLPDWLAAVIRNAYHDWSLFRARSFDEIFHVSRKGVRLPDREELELLRPKVLRRLAGLEHQAGWGRRSGDAQMREVADNLGISYSGARDTLYKDPRGPKELAFWRALHRIARPPGALDKVELTDA